MITERLSKRRAEMFKYARIHYDKFNVWTKDGEIFSKQEEEVKNITEYLYSIADNISQYFQQEAAKPVST